MAGKCKDYTGVRNNMLVAVRFLRLENRKAVWLMKCDCGNEKELEGAEIWRRESCGCLHEQRRLAAVTTHGMHKHKAYRVWVNMRERCNNPENEGYNDYGGRGIAVCEEWDHANGFTTFWNDMAEGYSEGVEIDRVNNNAGYSKDNCRWTSRRANSLNRRDTVFVRTPYGRMLLADAVEVSGLKWATLRYRERAGWPVEDMFLSPDQGNRWR